MSTATMIQFDEEALQNSPSLAARRASQHLHHHHHQHSQHTSSPLTQSARGQVSHSRSSTGMSGKTATFSKSRTKVVTRPAWARNEPPSPPDSPKAGPSSISKGTGKAGESSSTANVTRSQSRSRDQSRSRASSNATAAPAGDDDNNDGEYEDISDADEPSSSATLTSTSNKAGTASKTSRSLPQSASTTSANFSKAPKRGFWGARKAQRRMVRRIGAVDGGDGVSSVVAATDAARMFGSVDLFNGYQESLGRLAGARASAPKEGGEGMKVEETEEQGDANEMTSSPEKENGDDSSEERQGDTSARAAGNFAGGPATVMRARLKPKHVDDLRLNLSKSHGWESFTRRQPLSPGWESPWRPEDLSGNRQSIEVGGYRFHPSADGYFPGAKSGGARSQNTGEKGHGHNGGDKEGGWLTWSTWRLFLLHNPFVPLLFRFLNLCFTTCTLAVAIRIHLALKSENATNVVGASPVLAIVFAPLTLVHVLFQIYLEYFGRPIGLWKTASKLLGTLVEIIFVALWAAETALAFDNYFTSPLVCSPYNSPFSGPRQSCLNSADSQPVAGSISEDGEKPYICRLQGALIGLCFVSLLAYIIVLTVSWLRHAFP